VQNMGWLAHLGDLGYTLLMRCNGLVNFCRRRFGLGYWSLSAYVKAEVKNVVSFISRFEEAVVRYARDFDVDGVLCGHIHTAAIREIQGVDYYNAGDWVESCTAIVERYDGAMELLCLADEAPLGDSAARNQSLAYEVGKDRTRGENLGIRSGEVLRE
jgi:UDP-2,3-diacylglucosamine pyrophosphatase LpxH